MFSTQPQNGQLNPLRVILLTQVDIPERAAPDLPAQAVPVPNSQLHGGSSGRSRPRSVALPGLLVLVLMPHSPAVSDVIAALVSPLDTNETGKTAAAAPEQDGHGFPLQSAPQRRRPPATIPRDLTSPATGAGRAAAGTARGGRGAGAVPAAPRRWCPVLPRRPCHLPGRQ